MQLIADGKAPRIPQTEEGASYEGIQKKSNAKVSPPSSPDLRPTRTSNLVFQDNIVEHDGKGHCCSMVS